MRTLRLLHRWFGLALAPLVAAVAVSGGALLFDDALYRLHFPVLGQAPGAAEQAARPAVLAAIDARFGQDAIAVYGFPRPGRNAFQVWLRDGSEAFFDPRSGAMISHWQWHQTLPSILHELHVHLLAGEAGERINGVLALLAGGFVVTGALLWWPWRRHDRLHRPLPRSWRRGELLRLHSVAGVWLAPLLLLFALTGAAMVFYAPVERMLTAVFDDTAAPAPIPVTPAPAQRFAGWARLLPLADATFPEGVLRFCYPPGPGDAAISCRKRLPGEWHPNGRSFLRIDPASARVVQAVDARRLGTGMRATNAIYPLHAASVGGAPWLLAALASALVLGFIAPLGLLAWWRGRRERLSSGG